MGEVRVHRRRLEHPPVHASATFGGDDAQRFGEEFWSDRRHLVAVVRRDDDVERPRVVAPRHLAVGDEVVVAGDPGEQSRETGTTAFAQVDP